MNMEIIIITTQVAIIPETPPMKKFFAWLAIETLGRWADCCDIIYDL